MIRTTLVDRIRSLVNRDRLLDTAKRLIAVASPTGDAGAVLDTLDQLLKTDGFTVSRESASHPKAPAVLTRLGSGRPGKCLQFNGHLDVVHLPFVPPEWTVTSSAAAGRAT
jgi:acetylornithine deacetylase/succinyl-diaminopimelate desuccinylase-like protein